MGTIVAYSLTGSLALLAGWLAYRMFIAQGNSARFNRMVLLAVYAFALMLFPIMQIDFNVDEVVTVVFADQIADTAGIVPTDYLSQAGNGALNQLIRFYAEVAVMMLVMSIITALRIAVKVRRAKRKEEEDGVSIAVMNDLNIAPFSWCRTVVINERDYNENHSMILAHEKAHIKSCHFLDLILAQAVCAFMWYNPAAWLMLRELKLVHEYEADDAVLASGYNARGYQMLLIEKAAGKKFAILSNSLNNSGLRERIVHMIKPVAGSRLSRLRVAVLLPVAVVLVGILSNSAVSHALSRIESTSLAQTKVNDMNVFIDDKDFHGVLNDVNTSDIKSITINRQDKSIRIATKDGEESKAVSVPEFEGGLKELQSYIRRQSGSVPSDSRRVVVQMTVTAAGKAVDPRIIRSGGDEVDAEVIRVINEMPAKWLPARLSDGTPVDAPFTMSVNIRADN